MPCLPAARYSRALAEKLSSIGWKKSLRDEINSISIFERQLSDSGAIIIKFFLHITKDEQKLRLLERERNPLTAWLVTPSIWDFHHSYDTYLPIIDEFIEKTDTEYAPWHIIEATDRKNTILKTYSIVVKNLEKRVALETEERSKKARKKTISKPPKNPVIRRSSSGSSYSKEDCQNMLNNLQIEMLEINYVLFKRKIPFIIVYEGWDAAGKGGNITRLARYINPLGYNVVPVAAPNDYEKEHHYLWRFIRHYPKAGHFAIYDRSGMDGYWLNVWKGSVPKPSGNVHTRK